jgi:hypothetical protein
MVTALTGALAGAVHVLSGPDHLAAVTPLAIAQRRRSWLTGSTWGVGHASGVTAVAALAVLLRDVLPPVELIASWSEKIVGGALLAVGFWALRRGLRLRPGSHQHDGVAHDHLHVHAGPAFVRRLGHGHASFLMGVLHGLAGSSHFLGVLPALALPTASAAFTYIAAFGVATVVAMTAFTAFVGLAAERSRATSAHAYRTVVFAGAALAMVVGGFWLIHPAMF